MKEELLLEKANKIYNWKLSNKDNQWVQNLSIIWLNQLMRIKNESA